MRCDYALLIEAHWRCDAWTATALASSYGRGSVHASWHATVNDEHLASDRLCSAECNDLFGDVRRTPGPSENGLRPIPLFDFFR